MTGLELIGLALVVAGAGLALYTFVGYPLLLQLGSMVGTAGRLGRPEDTGIRSDELPSVSITVPVYNEVHQMEALLESLTALEYPRDRLQILIVSDGSDDGTDQVVESWAHHGVELLRVNARGGKGAAENEARDHLRGEVVVNTDASIRIQPGALGPLLAPFVDPEVGVVSGRDVSVAARSADANTGEAGYVGYEMWIRELETRCGGIVGASGCFYAIRKELHETEVPPELSRDFASALIARDQGFRAVSASDAVCYVPRTAALTAEYRRKIRTVARGMATLRAWRHLMNPLRYPGFAWKLVSHKVCRWLLPLALLLILIGTGLLAPSYLPATMALVVALAILALAGIGWRLGRDGRELPRFLSAPAFFLMSNLAVVRAAGRAWRGGNQRVWEPTRREVAGGP